VHHDRAHVATIVAHQVLDRMPARERGGGNITTLWCKVTVLICTTKQTQSLFNLLIRYNKSTHGRLLRSQARASLGLVSRPCRAGPRYQLVALYLVCCRHRVDRLACSHVATIAAHQVLDRMPARERGGGNITTLWCKVTVLICIMK
jgi:hypothetical protein